MEHTKKRGTHHKTHKNHADHNKHHKTTRHMDHNKKIITAIIVIFALIAVLIAYVLIFTGDTTTEIGEPDPISEQCQFFCDTSQRDAFCDVRLTAEEGVRETCNTLSTESQYSSYGVQTCPEFDCVEEEKDNTCEGGLNSEWVDATSEGECPEREGHFVRQRSDYSDEAPTGQICCFYYE